MLTTTTGNRTKAKRNFSRGLLGWHIVPPYLCYIPARNRVDQSGFRSPAVARYLAAILHHRHDSLRSVEGIHYDVDRPVYPRRRRGRYYNSYTSYLLRYRAPEAAPKVLPVGTRCLVSRVHPRSRHWRYPNRTCIMALVLPHQLPLLRHRLDCGSRLRPAE
jgi:hypothetical protein